MIISKLPALMLLGLCACSSTPQPPAATIAGPSLQVVVPATIAVSTVSREAAALFDEALVLSDAGDEPGAALKLKAALELDPKFALAHVASVGSGTNEEDAAHVEQARSALAALPKLERLWIELQLASETEMPAALAALGAEHSSDWRIQRELGEKALYGTLDKPLAREAFERAIALRPECISVRDALAYLYSDDARWQEALASAERQVALAPTRAAALETLAEVQLMAGNLDASEHSFRRALELDQSSLTAQEGLASVALLDSTATRRQLHDPG